MAECKRKIIQLVIEPSEAAGSYGKLIALADDGSVWYIPQFANQRGRTLFAEPNWCALSVEAVEEGVGA